MNNPKPPCVCVYSLVFLNKWPAAYIANLFNAHECLNNAYENVIVRPFQLKIIQETL